MPALVHIRGGGVAANCCAHLLQRSGLQVTAESIPHPPVPAIMLSETALALMRDVLGRPALFSTAHRIDRRVVAWGTAAALALPHSAVVVSEQQLLEGLAVDIPGANLPGDFLIHTARQTEGLGTRQRFGSRRAAAARVCINDPADASACMIESVGEGWLFLIPTSPDAAWLLGVGGPVGALCKQSRLIAGLVEVVEEGAGSFDTAPSILTPLYGAGWLACGTAAVAFDPICGDGTAQAVREAILASAVIAGVAGGGNAPSLLAHYEAVLVAAMRRHLLMSAEFYRSGGDSAWWIAQCEASVEGYRWCTRYLERTPEPQYELRGFELVVRKLAS